MKPRHTAGCPHPPFREADGLGQIPLKRVAFFRVTRAMQTCCFLHTRLMIPLCAHLERLFYRQSYMAVSLPELYREDRTHPMAALLLFIVALCVSIAIGLAAYLVVRRSNWSLWIRVPASILLSFTSVVLAGSVFLYGALAYVATDQTPSFSLGSDSDLSKPNDITVHISHLGSSKDIYLLSLEFPKYVTKGDDFTIHLSISPEGDSAQPKDREAVLYATNALKFWNTQPCPIIKPDGANSCGTVDNHTRSIDYYWTASASAEGQRTMTVIYPSLDVPTDWTATASSNNKQLLTCGLYHMDHCNGAKAVLSATNPKAKHSNIGRDVVDRHPPWFKLDMSARSITFPVEVILSLGVSSSTYQWLSIAGLVISGALGSGWGLTLLGSLRKKEKPPHEPFQPKGTNQRKFP